MGIKLIGLPPKQDTKEAFMETLYDILADGIEEPAGRGCGYGIRKEADLEISYAIDKLIETIRLEKGKT